MWFASKAMLPLSSSELPDGARGARPARRWLRGLGVAAIAALHLAAVYCLASVEYGPFANALALLTWAFLNFLLLIVLRRPGVSAALSLALITVLIALSQFKYGITQLTLTFLDFLIIDRDTFSFLH